MGTGSRDGLPGNLVSRTVGSPRWWAIVDVMEVALLGVGIWGQHAWLPPLVRLAAAGTLRLTAVDLPESPSALKLEPRLLESTVRRGHATYRSWNERKRLSDAQLAVIAVPARKHLEVLKGLLAASPRLCRVICEKPGGDSLAEFEEMALLCEKRGIDLLVVDHYLLCDPIRSLLLGHRRPEGIDEVERIEAYLLETRADGPAQDANLDMLVHVVNLLHTLYPHSRLVPFEARFAQALDRPHASVTHAWVRGTLRHSRREIPVWIEVGKQMREDRKRLVLRQSAPKRDLRFELGSGSLPNVAQEPYAGILERAISAVPSSNVRLPVGVLAPTEARRTWEELEAVRRIATIARRYRAGKPRTPPTV